MALNRRRVSYKEEFWFRARMIENMQVPMLLRRAVIKGAFGDASLERRYKQIGDREVIFFHVPKTGGTSIAKSLELPSGHVPISRFVASDPTRLQNAFSIAFVRNPWDRLYSAFNYLHSSFGLNQSRDVRWAEQNLAQFQNFEEFVLALRDDSTWRRIRRWTHFRAQTDWLCIPGSSEVSIDFLGRFETLNEDMARLNEQLGLDAVLTHERKSKQRDQKKFSAEMVDIIANLYERDARLLNYSGPSL